MQVLRAKSLCFVSLFMKGLVAVFFCEDGVPVGAYVSKH